MPVSVGTAPVDPALFERVQELRAERRTRHVAGGGGFTRRGYPLVRLLRCAECDSHYRGDACNGIRRIRHVARPACADSLTHRADAIEEQVAALLDTVRFTDADIDAVLSLVRLSAAPEPAEDGAGRDERRAELQADLAAHRISLEAFSRAWRALDRPVTIARGPNIEGLAHNDLVTDEADRAGSGAATDSGLEVENRLCCRTVGERKEELPAGSGPRLRH